MDILYTGGTPDSEDHLMERVREGTSLVTGVGEEWVKWSSLDLANLGDWV